MRCKCGFENTEGAVFCAECGAVLGVGAESEAKKTNAGSNNVPAAQTVNSSVGTSQTNGNKKTLLIVFCCIIIVFLGVIIGLLIKNSKAKSDESYNDTQQKSYDTVYEYDDNNNTVSNFSNVTIGDIVTFGTYEQDNDFSNGKEPIEWMVLDIRDGKALLLSKYELFSSAYNETRSDVTWETCSLRSKLNYQFFNEAFSDEEKNVISNTNVSADSNPKQASNSGNSTVDKVFLLSVLEINRYFSTYDEMHSYPTAYAIATGSFAFEDNGGTGAWWTRTPGKVQSMCAIVGCVDGVLTGGDYVDFAQDSVRPAVWIQIN